MAAKKPPNFYTTIITVEKSMMAVEKLLVELGAKEIHKVYEDGKVFAMHFMMLVNKAEARFKMPLRIDVAYERIQTATNLAKNRRTMEQAERIVWKNLHEWLKTMTVLIDLGIRSPLDLFLPDLIVGHIGNGKLAITLKTQLLNASTDGFKDGFNLLPTPKQDWLKK